MPIKGITEGSPYDQIRIQQEQERAKSGQDGVNKSTQANDGVTVSENARLRSVAHKAATAADDVRADKIAALKAKVQSGEYQPDGQDIAERIVEGDLELFG